MHKKRLVLPNLLQIIALAIKICIMFLSVLGDITDVCVRACVCVYLIAHLSQLSELCGVGAAFSQPAHQFSVLIVVRITTTYIPHKTEQQD